MTRRELFAASAAGLAAAMTTPAQTAAYPGTPYPDYSRCLPDFLRELARTAYQKRNSELNRLTNTAAIQERQRWVSETLWRLIGGMPQRTPLNPRVTGSLEKQGYRLEKVVYESQPKLFVTANAYVPTAINPPFPAVLFHMGHSLDGKAYDPYQRCCQGLARLGFFVLAFDPMGQGERIYYPAGPGRTRLRSADDEHTVPGKQLLLTGDTATRLQLWDAVRSLDYLLSRPEVDRDRVGSTGQSGGATITMLLAAVDPRLAAAVVNLGNTENVACANFNPPGSTDDAEQDLLGSGPLGFDRWDLLYPLAPKPLLVTVSSKDAFGTYSPRYIENGWEEYLKLMRVYQMMGHPDRLEWADSPLPHNLGYYLRVRTYHWFARWLMGSHTAQNRDRKQAQSGIESEPEVSPEPERTLWAGATGNVIADFNSATPFQLNRQRAESLKPVSTDLRKLLAIPPLPASKLRTLAKTPSSAAISIDAIEIQSEDQIRIPAWLFTPRNFDRAQGVLLLVDSRGRNLYWSEGGLCEQLAKTGRMVCAADLRGYGDMQPEVGRGAPRYEINHSQEEDYAWASLIFGRPLLGQRVIDILALAAALRTYGPVTLAANRDAGVPALFAAALDPKLEHLHLCGMLASFRQIVQAERYRCPLANIVPGLLAHTDLPEVAASLAPRRIHIAGAVDASGALMGTSAVRALYPGQNVSVSSEEDWSVAMFLS